jgi:hypothetical protein
MLGAYVGRRVQLRALSERECAHSVGGLLGTFWAHSVSTEVNSGELQAMSFRSSAPFWLGDQHRQTGSIPGSSTRRAAEMGPLRYEAMLTPGGSRLPELCLQKLIGERRDNSRSSDRRLLTAQAAMHRAVARRPRRYRQSRSGARTRLPSMRQELGQSTD